MLSAPTVETEYHGYRKSYTNSVGDRNTTYWMQKRRTLDLDWPLKVVASLVVLALMILVSLLTPWWLTFPINIILTYMNTKIIILGRLKVEKMNTNQIAKSLRDEAGECISTLNDLTRASSLTPEGSGIRTRTTEYGRMLWNIMHKLQSLEEANELIGGKGTDFYKNILVLKTQLKDLDYTGESLVELTVSKRMDSVMQDMSFMGISEFKNEVNMEMMAHRSLGAGEVEEELEPPFGGMDGVFADGFEGRKHPTYKDGVWE